MLLVLLLSSEVFQSNQLCVNHRIALNLTGVSVCNFYRESFTKALAVKPANIPHVNLIYGVGIRYQTKKASTV